MLRRLVGHGCWSNASPTTLGLLLRCRRRSTLVGARPVASPVATNARWAMLNDVVLPRNKSIVADPKTVAARRTSAFGGGQLRVSLSVAPPPAERSFLYYDWTPGSAELAGPRHFAVVAAHGDSVLFAGDRYCTGDCSFVYRAGAATRPPSLSQLLPARDVPGDRRLWRTGLLRRREDQLLVAQLVLTSVKYLEAFFAEVWVLHVGRREWELKPAIIVDGDDEMGDGGAVKRGRLRRWWLRYGYEEGGKVVPVGNRFLCWVDLIRGFVLLCDMAADQERSSRLRLRYVPLPMTPTQRTTEDSDSDDDERDAMRRRWEIESSRDICGVVGGALKFVSIDVRCCCCARSSNAFLVTTWTLAPRTDGDNGPIEWVKDAELDCEELWAMPGYDGLPRVQPRCPVVSLEDPDVVSFEVGEAAVVPCWKPGQPRRRVWEEEWKVWMVEIDMRKKALLSRSMRCPDYNTLLPVKLHY